MILLTAAPALSDAISVNSYGTWKWNGSSWSLLTASVAASKPATLPAASSLTYSALTHAVDSGSSGGTASLSGFVYVDMDKDGNIDTSDWAIADAKIVLSKSGSSDLRIVFSGKDGSYNFDGLLDGAYSIAMATPVSVPGQDNGHWWILSEDKTTIIKTGPSGPLLPNAYENIDLGQGQAGKNFSFAEWVYPVDAYTKRMFMGDNPGILHTAAEPNSLVLLAIAGLFFGGLTWRRCGKHRG